MSNYPSSTATIGRRVRGATLAATLGVATFVALAVAGMSVSSAKAASPSSVRANDSGPRTPTTGRQVVAVVLGRSGSETADVFAPYEVFASSPAFAVYTIADSAAPPPPPKKTAQSLDAGDLSVLANMAFPQARPLIDVQLDDGVGEIEAAALLEVYSYSQAATANAVSATGTVTTSHGLLIKTVATGNPTHDVVVAGGLVSSAGRHGFDAAFEQLSRNTNPTVLTSVAKMLEYPLDPGGAAGCAASRALATRIPDHAQPAASHRSRCEPADHHPGTPPQLNPFVRPTLPRTTTNRNSLHGGQRCPI